MRRCADAWLLQCLSPLGTAAGQPGAGSGPRQYRDGAAARPGTAAAQQPHRGGRCSSEELAGHAAPKAEDELFQIKCDAPSSVGDNGDASGRHLSPEGKEHFQAKCGAAATNGGDQAASSAQAERKPAAARIGLWLGPALGLCVWQLLLLVEPQDMAPRAQRVAGMAVWMAVWWTTEAVHLGVTSLLPLALFPPLRILATDRVAREYSQNLAWLFFGGFQMAFAIERTGLHQRLAFLVIRAMGTRPALLLLGVMLSVGVLSMFLSNTSTTLMVLPIAQAIAAAVATAVAEGRPGQSLGAPLMLGLAYSASSGGLGTLVGTPPNGVLVVQAQKLGVEITFAQWMAFGMPLALLMIALIWLYLVAKFRVPFAALPEDHPALATFRCGPGPMSQAEVRVAGIFALTVIAWCIRKDVVGALGLEKGVLEDDTISMTMAISLFLIPARSREGEARPLMDWEALLQTPWHILFLFGGGFALAAGFQDTGLSKWLGLLLSSLGGLPPWLLVLLVVLLVTFLTEVTSNTATANVLLPVVGAVAKANGQHPALLMVPATLAASCAFMLPVATPPNAVVFATGLVSMKDMVRSGFVINLASAMLITFWTLTWGQVCFGRELLS